MQPFRGGSGVQMACLGVGIGAGGLLLGVDLCQAHEVALASFHC